MNQSFIKKINLCGSSKDFSLYGKSFVVLSFQCVFGHNKTN